jgi:hypothetical protein
MSSSFVVDTKFAEAFLNADHFVLGQKLLPYCSWHKLQLEVANSPLLLGELAHVADLEYAVRVCQTVYPQMVQLPKVDSRWKRFLWFLRIRKYKFAEELRKFSTYLDDFVSGPKLWEKKQAGTKEPDVDDNFEAVTYYFKSTGVSEVEAWMMPLGKLRWYNTLFARQDGADIDFWTPDDEVAFQEHVKKREAGIDEQAKVYAADGMEYAAARERANAEYWAKVNEKLGKQ